MREKIEKELDRVEANGIVKTIWATPFVPVPKKDGAVRICNDYEVTVNRQIEQNRCPLASIEDIALNLARGEKFTELDFSHAWTPLELHDDSKQYTP
ncbi:transposon ty3-i Gag-Pol polyprotein [Plakobranchus ocellatus]|uniref:Transposon ty3-i Gag-Pol polyprotein n=1 Tax=Plakobranchus ocellatus TaxID=259542 RepID=A0AAV4D2C8_9GAST|nr:transposon ty3-i Gag-Pol polyprotein [Plakobranchus ocellatus]